MMNDHDQKKRNGVSVSLAELPDLARQVARDLKETATKPFVLWLVGDLGAGKTTFAAALLHALGVPGDVPVLSPTYTYLTEYETNMGLCAHMDLYRMVEGDLDSVESLLSGRNFKGLIVEWPHRGEGSPFLEKTHQIQFEFGAAEDQRVVTFEAFV